jgi:ankyrin repeat protein
MAAENGDPRVNPGPNCGALYAAAKNGHTFVVQLLLEDGRISPAAGYNDAIRQASRFGHEIVVQLLLNDSRADPADPCCKQ